MIGGSRPPARALRRLVAATFLVLLATGFAVLVGYRAGHYGSDFGFSLLVTESALLLTFLLWLQLRELDRADRALSRRALELEDLNRELDAFAYSVSHDLRSPLRAVRGFGAILEEEHGGELGTEGRRVLGVLRENAERIDEAGVRVARGDLPPAAGDPDLLEHVWENLLDNAVKYSSHESEPRVTVSGAVEGDELVYRVEDDGVGFDMAYAHKLFTVFHRLHARHELEGTGVGLAIVRGIVQRHGGRVWAEAERGRGATFSFALPVTPHRTPTADRSS